MKDETLLDLFEKEIRECDRVHGVLAAAMNTLEQHGLCGEVRELCSLETPWDATIDLVEDHLRRVQANGIVQYVGVSEKRKEEVSNGYA